MKIKNNIAALLVGLGLLTGCSDAFTLPTPTVGEADNAITLHAGISDGGSGVQTRAEAEDHHSSPGHKLFTSGTIAALRIDGDWWKTAEATSGDPISQTTSATMGGKSATEGNGLLHNSLTMSPQLYWDDYGTADPNNTADGRGRKKGLTIYGVAVDGITTAPTVGNWTSLSWTLDSDQKTNNWNTKDLLISNNVKEGTGDGTYKFDTNPRTKLLEFTHAMSKITVRLIASDGFPTAGVGATATKFATAPEVKLTSNETGQSNAEWANTACNINVTDGTYSNSGTPAIITMHTAKTDDSQYTVIYDALVAPGSVFGDATGAHATYPIIARINADGNIYYVTSEKIRAAITTKYGSGNELGFATQPGVNYIITVNVKKTKIEVTATIKDWIDVEAEIVEPVINVTTKIGDNTTDSHNAFNSFDFYLSDDADSNHATNYNSSSKTATATAPTGDSPTDGNTVWNFSPSLYWPSHSTHYHMRGVYPSNTTVTNGKISVTAGDYNSTTSPSNIMVGAPVFTDANKNCNNSDHTSVDMSQHGICARESATNLTFNYMMSQVEVRLTTPTSGSDIVNLANAKVEIIDGYTTGDIDVHNKTVAVTGSTSPFTLNHLTSENNNYRHSIIVPQALTHNATDLKFRITIFKSGSTTEVDDIYTAVIKDIKVKDPNTADISKLISEWERGKHYIYTLDMRKTEVKVTATLTDWITVTADEPIWF